MKKAVKQAAALFLVVVLAMLFAVPAFAAEADELQIRVVDGEEFVSLRQAAEAQDLHVAWDRPTQTVIMTDQDGNVGYVVVAEVGGFNERGTIWVPVELVDLLLDFIYIPGDEPVDVDEPVDTDDPETYAPEPGLLDRPPLVRTTDHGEMAIGFITEMSDNLYNRLPFTYRELEAAEWIVDELVAMGFDEDMVVIQSFYLGDVEEHIPDIFGWFADVVRLGVAGEDFDPVESFYQELIAEFAEMGIPYYAVADAIGVEDLREVIELEIIPVLMFLFEWYGVFSDTVEFRPYSQNVILTIPGQSEQKIVMTAHYDTIYGTPGASDNASGVALLMESAYSMLDADNYYTLVYVFAGAEEAGLLGAYYYYLSLTPAQQANILVNINADVLFEGPYFFFGTGQFYEGLVGLPGLEVASHDLTGFGVLENDITRMITQIAEELNALHGTQLIGHRYLTLMTSDHLVFLENGHTVVALAGLARACDMAYAGFNFDVSPMTIFEGLVFGGSIVHSPYDNVHFINEAWSEKIANAMWTFSLFLEALLTASF